MPSVNEWPAIPAITFASSMLWRLEWWWANADKVGALAQVVIGLAAVAALIITVLALRGTGQAIALQRKEFDTLREQVELEAMRFAREQHAARPLLRIHDVILQPTEDGPLPAQVILAWVHGTDLAQAVEVWVLTAAHVLFGTTRYIAPGDREQTVRLMDVGHTQRDHCPFPWRSHSIAGNVFWAGVVWLRSDASEDGFSQQFVDHGPRLIVGGIERETITRNQGPGPERRAAAGAASSTA